MGDNTEKLIQDVRSGDYVMDKNMKPVKVHQLLVFHSYRKDRVVEIPKDVFEEGVPNKTLFLTRAHEIAVKPEDELRKARHFKNPGIIHHKRYPVSNLYNLSFERVNPDLKYPSFYANNLIVSGVYKDSKYIKVVDERL